MPTINLKIKDPTRSFFFLDRYVLNPLTYTAVDSEVLTEDSKQIVLSALIGEILISDLSLIDAQSLLRDMPQITVVDTIAQRDALSPSVGMEVVVLVGASGSRERYVYRSGAWALIETTLSIRMGDLLDADLAEGAATDNYFVKFNWSTRNYTLAAAPVPQEITAARVRQLYESNSGILSFSTSDKAKLDSLSVINPGNFALAAHTHSEYALSGHNHNGLYAPISHNHDASYAQASHNHDARYELKMALPGSNGMVLTRNTNGSTTFVTQASIAGQVIDDGAASTARAWSSQKVAQELTAKAATAHNHDLAYAPISHSHAQYITKTEAGSLIDACLIVLGQGNTLQERISNAIETAGLTLRPASTAGVANFGNAEETLVVTHNKNKIAVDVCIFEGITTGPAIQQGIVKVNLADESVVKTSADRMSFGVMGLQLLVRNDAAIYIHVRFA